MRMDHSVVMPLAKRSPWTTKEVEKVKYVSYKHSGPRHIYTRDSEGWQHCVVIPLAKRPAWMMGKVEKVKERVVPRQRREKGRTKVR